MSVKTAKNIKNRIKSIKNTRRITNAMKLVATSKSKKAMDDICGSREYYDEIIKTVLDAANEKEAKSLPYFTENYNSNKTCTIVIAGDRGLAGGYNINIFKEANKFHEADIISIGKKSCERFTESKIKYAKTESITQDNINELAEWILKSFIDGKYRNIYIIHTEFITMLSQVPKITRILPVDYTDKKEDIKRSATIYEPSLEEVLKNLIFQYIVATIYSMIKEAFLCETASRRVAMEAATKSADEMLDSLYMDYNRARQSAVTQELSEIVSGAGIL